MNPKLLRHYSNILNEAAYQTGAQFMASRPPAAQPDAPAAGTAAATRAGQGTKPTAAPLPSSTSAPGDGTFQNDPNVGAGAKAIGKAVSGFLQGGSAGTSGRGGGGKPSAPLPSNPSAPAYNTGKASPAKIGTQNFNMAGGAGKPTATPAAPNYSSAVKSANAAFAANQAKAPQGNQTAGGKTNASFLPGAAGGAKPAAAPTAEPTPAPQANALGIAPQANGPGMQSGPAAEPTPAPQANALGIAPQANGPGMQTGTAPASQGAKPAPGPVGLGSAIGAPGMATASNPASVNPPTRGGPQVTGSENLSTDSDDVIAKRGPMGIQMKEEELEEELNEIMRLSGTTAWKSHNKSKVTEGLSLTEGGGTLDHVKNRFKHEVKNFMAHGQMDSDLYHALYDYYRDTGEIPYSVVKDDPHSWVEERFYMDMGSGMSEGMIDVAPSTELTELARLAGLSESQVAECGDMDMEQEDSMSVNTNMSSDGTKSVSISAQGDKADALLQMLKMAGMRPHDDHDHGHKEVVMIGTPDDEMMDEGMMDEASSQRLIDKLGDSALGAKIYKDLEWSEYVVKFVKDGKLTSDESWYHTDDLDDAMSTAQKEMEFMQQHGNNDMMEGSGGVQVHDLSRMSGRELYDETQTNDDIHDGDVLMTDSGVGIMVEAWPVIVAGDIQGFHKLKDTSWEEFEGGKYLDSYNKAMEVSGSVQEEYANEPDEKYQTVNSIMRQGDDLNREKQQYKHGYRNSDNPMAMELDEELTSLLDSILVREEMTDVLKAEQPYKDEKTGKMVTPPKGATMPPADSPPAAKSTVKK